MYDQISRNKRDTVILVTVMFLLFLALGYGLGLILPHLFSTVGIEVGFENGQSLSTDELFPAWHRWLGTGLAAIFWAIAVLVAWFGGRSILLSTGGAVEADRNEHAQLINVVEEMAIAAGVPRPQVYVIPDNAPNAFATGSSPDKAAIAVTTGLLQKLNRDELQGVVAHELAHIRNLDTRLLMMMTILVGGLALLVDITRPRYHEPTWYGHRRSNDWLLFILLAVSALFAKGLQMAVSRRREFLADATAALITRYPDGLASALEKIARDPSSLMRASQATAHLYIMDPCASGASGGALDDIVSMAQTLDDRSGGLFQTHPSVVERIRRLKAMGFSPAGAAENVSAASQVAPPVVPADNTVWNAPAAPLLPLDMSPTARRLAREVLAQPEKSAIRQLGPASPPEPALFSSPLMETRSLPTGARRCPRCQEMLLPGTILRYDALGCRHCGGVWTTQDAYENALRENPDVLDAADRRFPNLIGYGWDRVKDRMCPICGLRLLHYKVDRPVGVDLDRCPDCRGLWFDDGELSALAWASKRPKPAVR